MQQISMSMKDYVSGLRVPENLPQNISQVKTEAISFFSKNGFPSQEKEEWRNTNFSSLLDDEFVFAEKPEETESNFILKCDIPHLQTKRLTLLNGYCSKKEIETLDNGVIIGSFEEAVKHYPDLVNTYFGAYSNTKQNGYLALNTALAIDGIFVYVPKNVVVEKAVQIQNVIKSNQSLFIQTRNLIILEENSSLKFIQCDDSYNKQRSFSNHVTEIFLKENSKLEHYKLQSLNDNSGLLNFNYSKLEKNAQIISNAITLNGGIIKNYNDLLFNSEGCDAQLHGLYIIDKEQKVNNYVFVDHAHPNCQSKELFKGILDGNAKGVFNGHVMVRKNATGTQAYQSNKNLLLTSKAQVITKPFLEIYNDDVKCSHGATTGQLDSEALFYLRSRGISEHTARTLLMYAYCDEILNKVSIQSLKNCLGNIVQKRLNGELAICEQCALHCSSIDCNSEYKTD